MLDRAKLTGLPLKYAVLAAFGAVIGHLLFAAFGYRVAGGLEAIVPAAAVGGFIGGLIRQKRNSDS